MGFSCYQKYKEQKLKANHNYIPYLLPALEVVTKNTKNKSWKQITTYINHLFGHQLLLPKIQRTKVESKSQPAPLFCNVQTCCYQKYKEQKLKANHNF